jgi:hypothetical protein
MLCYSIVQRFQNACISVPLLNILLLLPRNRNKSWDRNGIQFSEGLFPKLARDSSMLGDMIMVSRIISYQPRPRPPHQTPQPKRPCPRIIKPPPDGKNLCPTCLRENALWELIIPFVFHRRNLPRRVRVDIHDAVDDLFFADAFDFIPVAKVHGYRVTRGGHVEGESLDFRECSLQAIPLCLVLFAAFGFGEGVGEEGVVLLVGLVGG